MQKLQLLQNLEEGPRKKELGAAEPGPERETTTALVVHGCDLGVRRSIEMGELWAASSCKA